MRLIKTLPLLLVIPLSQISAQVVQITDANSYTAEESLNVKKDLPELTLTTPKIGNVHLLDGLFKDRRELTKAYILRLKTDNILQNHYLEAGVRIEPAYEDMHLGWESPHYQLRGHFAGHWLSAAAHFAALDDDPVMTERVREAVDDLKHCQDLNKDGWIGSIPEKYLTILADGKPIWSPQYTLHKTMMGLLDAYKYLGNEEALQSDILSADWFLKWTDEMIQDNTGEAIYGGECAGMLELWCDLYADTGNKDFLKLASRYAMPDIFKELLAGEDALSNKHANASIPWIQGAARLYEVTGDTRYRNIVFQFWKEGVTDRGMFATTGNNAGEFWIPKQQFNRFLGSRTQEHCTVYNMIRVAQYLFEWTGDSEYADYIERALYNGILAQQNPHTGLVAYFLPTEPGGKKVWGTETHDFWCCHGTLVQAQAMYEDLIYYKGDKSISVSQFIPSKGNFELASNPVSISQTVDWTNKAKGFSEKSNCMPMTLQLKIDADNSEKWTLKIRQPEWATSVGTVSVNGKPVKAQVDEKGFLEVNRSWSHDEIEVTFTKELRQETLPGDESRIALLDGPIVLAAITENEPLMSKDSSLTPMYEHQYISGREWQTGHYLMESGDKTYTLKPLFEIADEKYAIYFRKEAK
jgi:hypothetical protein